MARSNIALLVVAAGVALITTAPALEAAAQVRGGGRASIARTHPAPNHVPDHRPNPGGGGNRPPPNPNRPDRPDRNVDINVDRHVDVDVDHRWDWDDDHHPVARGVAFGTAAAVTAAAVGSLFYSLPPACSPYAGSYYYCGGVYYEPRYQGDTVVYVVVDRPG